MVIPDTNVLLYAINSNLEQHDACRKWLEAALSDERPVGFAWNVLLGVVRISTKSGIFPKPLQVSQAMSYVDEWLAQPPSLVIRLAERIVFIPTGLRLIAQGCRASRLPWVRVHLCLVDPNGVASANDATPLG